MKTRTHLLASLTLIVLLAIALSASAQRLEINIPDIPGYTTLKCDFHMHTVFSDGSVWPTVRVDEAWRDGLDVIAISDHVEYQPHKGDIPTNHKRPYEIALGKARECGILLVRAAEITRDTPPGHYNALFLTDIDALDTAGKSSLTGDAAKEEEFLMQLRAAKAQNAFVFWNHPDWKARNGQRVWFDIHTKIFDEGLVNGIEAVNGRTFHVDSLKWANERNLTLFGNSDIHAPMNPRTLDDDAVHRPVTLVFAYEKTLESVRKAIDAGRTAIWFENKLIGRSEYLEAILQASLKVAPPHMTYRNTAYVSVQNISDITYELVKTSGTGPATATLPARATTIVRIGVNNEGKATLGYKVTNLITGPDACLTIEDVSPW
ncbi:MAG: histidinol-phosphatase [Phycisphaerae bacterium]|nr:histidinol-phosphatase [Phycisphaerae bacterium]